MRTILISILKVYKLAISPFLGQNCRFQPTCSEYAIEAIQVHGCLKGMSLATKRVCRCRPGQESGFDPVPESNAQSNRVQTTAVTLN